MATEKMDLIVKLSKPYAFEGKNYEEVDLSGLENVNGANMVDALNKSGGSAKAAPVPEMSMPYAFTMAAQVTGLPVEFFMGLPGRDCIKIKNRVSGFFFGGD